jgi:hypothetical protein
MQATTKAPVAMMGTGTPAMAGILAARLHRLIEDRIDDHRERDDLGGDILDHPFEIAVAGFGIRHLHSSNARLQDAFKARDLQIEVRHLGLAHQSAHDSLP